MLLNFNLKINTSVISYRFIRWEGNDWSKKNILTSLHANVSIYLVVAREIIPAVPLVVVELQTGFIAVMIVRFT